jgi:hypothetical protein
VGTDFWGARMTVGTDWAAVGEEFRQRRTTTLVRSLDRDGVRRAVIDDALGPDHPATADDFARAWSESSRHPGASLTLAAYLYARCQAAWELTVDYERIAAAIDKARDGWDRADHPPPAEGQLVDLMLRHVESLTDCMYAEGAVNCSCPIALAKHADAVAADSSTILESLRRLIPSGAVHADGFTSFLADNVESHRLTYDAVADTARSVLSWLLAGDGSADAIEAAKDRLGKAADDPLIAGDVYASELRAHRFALDGLIRHTPGPQVPDLTITEARIVYCYPFAVPGALNWPELAGRANRLWGSGGTGPRLAGERPVLLESTELSDIWDTDKYQGLTLTLPSITVRTTAGLELAHTVDLRLSSLGNHYVRIERDGRGLGLHDVYQGLRRASKVMGAETVIGESGASWSHLHEYAAAVVGDLTGVLQGSGQGSWAVDFGSNFNVELEIRQAHVRAADGTPREATVDDILTAAARLLLHPVTGYATALEEWTRRPAPDLDNLAGDAGYDGDLVARTDNTTVLILPGSPSWIFLGMEEKVEFIAALPPLLRQWQSDLRHNRQRVDDLMRHAGLDRRGLELQRLELAQHAAHFRDRLDELHSSALCTPAVHRRFLDRLYVAAGLPRLEEELEAEIREVEAMYERVAAWLSILDQNKAQVEEENTKTYQKRIQVILGVLAALTVVGPIDWITKLFTASGDQAVPAAVAITEIVGVIVAVVVVGVVFLRMGRQKRRADGP